MEQTINFKQIITSSVINNKLLMVSVVPLFVSYWLQDIVFTKSFGSFTTNMPEFVKNIDMWSVAYLIFPYLTSQLLFYTNDMIVANTFPKIELSVIEQITQKVMQSIKTSKTSIQINDFMMNLKKILDIKNIYFLFISQIIPTIIVCLAIIYYFVMADTKCSLLVIIILVIFLFITFKSEYGCVSESTTNQENIDKMYDCIHDIIGNADSVIVSNTLSNESKNISELKNSACESYVRSESEGNNASLMLHIMSIGLVILLDIIAIYIYKANKISASKLVTICFLTLMFMEYYNSTTYKFKNLLQHIGKFVEVDEYFGKFKIIANTIKPKFKIGLGDIELQNINLSHEDKIIFKNLNLTIRGGEVVGLKGKIGRGKTTILKMIAGLISYEGKILVDGQNISEYDYDSVMRQIVYISQHPKLFNKSIYYNLNYGSNYSESQIQNIINKFKLNSFFNQFPEGLQTIVGKEGNKLSGGQKQFMSLVRVLIQNKSILLLDEPTSSLDPQTKELFINLIKSLSGRTILITTHDQTIDDLFDNQIRL